MKLSFPRKFVTASSIVLCGLLSTTSSQAATITINLSGLINLVDGSYSPDLAVNDSMNAVFKYDTDEAQAISADTAGSNEPGHEYSSFYDFASPPYGGTVTHQPSGGTFSSAIAGVVVNDNLSIESSDLNNLIPTGTYDWIEILGSTTVDGPTGSPADGEEWTLAIFSTDTSWITDGTLIPDNLPVTYTAVLVGAEFDAAENEIGTVIVDVTSLTVTAVPEPSSIVLLGIGGLSFACRRKRRHS